MLCMTRLEACSSFFAQGSQAHGVTALQSPSWAGTYFKMFTCLPSGRACFRFGTRDQQNPCRCNPGDVQRLQCLVCYTAVRTAEPYTPIGHHTHAKK